MKRLGWFVLGSVKMLMMQKTMMGRKRKWLRNTTTCRIYLPHHKLYIYDNDK